MKYIFSCLLLLSAMLLSGSVENDRVNGSALLATVNGEAVTLGQVVGESASGERLAQAYATEDKNSEIFKLRQAAVDRIIDRKLMIAEFKRLKLTLPTHYVESLMDDLAENMGCKTRSELAAKARAMKVPPPWPNIKAIPCIIAWTVNKTPVAAWALSPRVPTK